MIGHLLAVRKGENVMSTKTGNMRRMILSGGVAALITLGMLGAARADITSDQAAAILIFPKLVVDTSAQLGPATDSEVQITNTSNSVVAARCFLINATSFCSNSPVDTPIACTPETEASSNPKCTGGTCVPQWTENDFRMTLTKRQPVSWKVSEGRLSDFPLSPSSSVPRAQTDPFIGELRCVEVDPTTFQPISGFNPVNNGAGDLKGEATIVSTDRTDTTAATGKVDARKYNAIGIQATDVNNGDDTLNIGGADAEYTGCPNVIIVDHLFDDANVQSTGGTTGTVRTDLTITPCGADLNQQIPNAVTLQFLVFNEFEQRFSTSTRITCSKEVQLSNIDTRPTASDNFASIFNVNVQGTFAGQTRIRPVADTANGIGDTVLAVAEEFWDCKNGPPVPGTSQGRCSTAANVHFQGSRDLGDTMVLPSDSPPSFP
jgi:hypothetical protein